MVKFRNGSFGGGSLGGSPGSSAFLGTGHAFFLREETPNGSQVDQLVDDTYVIQLPSGTDLATELDRLRTTDTVEYAEPDPVAYALYAPNDPGYPEQWAHQNVHSAEAWDIGQGSRTVIVAEIDTGVDYTHPDLAANIYTDPKDGTHGYNFVANTTDPMADDSPRFHGTHTAGSIGAIGNNGVGIIGQSPNVTILPLKFLGANGSGNTSDAVRAIYYGIQKGAKVMSNSWGGSASSQTLAQAIDAAKQAGILFVAAAGNGNAQGVGQNNDQVPTYPASYSSDNMIVVAATDSNDQLTSFSNYGSSSVHVGAPGLEIYSTKNGGGYQKMSGTSMATPLVAGLAASMIALRPDLSYQQIKAAILNNVDVVASLQGKTTSGGRVNAYKAMNAIKTGGGTPTPAPSSSPAPNPTPVPTPPPAQSGMAAPPLINGQLMAKVTNPYAAIEVDYDVSAFGGSVEAYIEVSRPNQPFSNPNGVTADPYRYNYRLNYGPRGGFSFVPAQDLRVWGTFQFRVIGVDGSGRPTNKFSNPSMLVLSPN